MGGLSGAASLATLTLAAGLRPVAAQAPEWRTDFTRHTAPLEEIVPGGPPKDGIPALDHPKFVGMAEADRWLKDREPVVLLVEGGEARAYPLQVLIWHEIVNDVVGGRPIAITYCPLCNTALAFDRRLDGRVLDFGTTGRLRHSDLVMYDRQTESWWQQATGEAIVGEYAGRQLEFISAPLVSWRTFKEAHPDGRVLSRDTGFERPYGFNPYRGYDEPESSPRPAFFHGRADGRLPAMERVVAVSHGGEEVAYPFSRLRREPVVNDRIGDLPLVVMWAPGTASPVDASEIWRGRDVGATGVFDRRLDHRLLEFEPARDGTLHDRQTGSRWDLLGSATAGPLRGRRLAAVPHGNHFWFAWAAFKPGTRLLKGGNPTPPPPQPRP
jgi:hypothetical protein